MARQPVRRSSETFGAEAPGRILGAVRLVALAVLIGVAIAPAASIASPQAPPALRVVDRSPLTVLGTGFKPRERVVVSTMKSENPARVKVVASRKGRFRARLQVTFDPCTGPAFIRATGIKGSIVVLKLGLRECPGPVEVDPPG
jgi:hypothetical protein